MKTKRWSCDTLMLNVNFRVRNSHLSQFKRRLNFNGTWSGAQRDIGGWSWREDGSRHAREDQGTIARRQARQWMTRIDKDLKEIRDTRSAIQTKIIMIEAAMEENNLSVSPTGTSRIDPEVLRSQIRDEIRREAESLRHELNEKLDEINFMGVGDDFQQKPQEPDQISSCQFLQCHQDCDRTSC